METGALLGEQLAESVAQGFRGFGLRFQPIVYAEGGKLYGCEVLLEYHQEGVEAGAGPEEFVPVLEQELLMERVGGWVLEQALARCARWQKKLPGFHMNINVTYRQFLEPGFSLRVVELLNRFGAVPSGVTLELTESSQITDTEELRHVFDFLRSQGVRIAFDDFGMGYASLAIFRLLRVDCLKIDKSFLERITFDVTDQKIVGQLISLSHSMGMVVCVEGIEDANTDQVVRQMKPELLQGYYYSMPLGMEEFEQLYLAEAGLLQGEPPVIFPEPFGESMDYSDMRPVQAMELEKIFNSVDAAVFHVKMDEEFTFLACNDGLRRMLGFTALEIEGKFGNKALRLVHPEDRERVDREVRRQIGQGGKVWTEFRVVRSDGKAFWVAGTASVVKDPHGGHSLAGVALDNEQSRQAAVAAGQQVERYEQLLAGAPACLNMLKADRALSIEYISPDFLSMLGYQENDIKELFGGGYGSIIYEEDRERVLEAWGVGGKDSEGQEDGQYGDLVETGICGGERQEDSQRGEAGEVRRHGGEGQEDSQRGEAEDDVVALRYRAVRKDGTLSLLDTISRISRTEGGGRRICSNVMDVTKVPAGGRRSRLAHLAERFQEASRQWGDVLLEYRFEDRALFCTENFRTLFGWEPDGTLEGLLASLCQDDAPLLLRTLEQMEGGGNPEPLELRVKSLKTGGFVWCSLMFTPVGSEGGRGASTLGKLTNIDTEKRERERLLEKFQLDPLTELLNRKATEEQISQVLASGDPDACYGLFAIDLDNFRELNSKYGHMTGDQALAVLAERIRGLFRRTDVIGRVGGDEFVALMECREDVALLKEKGMLLVRELGRELQADGVAICPSVSVGIAHYPSDGKEFYELYRRAGSAVYRAKELGKGRCCLASE